MAPITLNYCMQEILSNDFTEKKKAMLLIIRSTVIENIAVSRESKVAVFAAGYRYWVR